MEPKPFEILEHTADLRLYASGKIKEELFSNMLLGMSEIIKHREPGKEEDLPKREKISIDSADLNALLVDFLSEVLYLSNIHKTVYRKINFESFSDTNLAGEIFGRKVEGFDEDIKAVTYHQLEIKQGEDGYWEGTVIFDI